MGLNVTPNRTLLVIVDFGYYALFDICVCNHRFALPSSFQQYSSKEFFTQTYFLDRHRPCTTQDCQTDRRSYFLGNYPKKYEGLYVVQSFSHTVRLCYDHYKQGRRWKRRYSNTKVGKPRCLDGWQQDGHVIQKYRIEWSSSYNARWKRRRTRVLQTQVGKPQRSRDRSSRMIERMMDIRSYFCSRLAKNYERLSSIRSHFWSRYPNTCNEMSQPPGSNRDILGTVFERHRGRIRSRFGKNRIKNQSSMREQKAWRQVILWENIWSPA